MSSLRTLRLCGFLLLACFGLPAAEPFFFIQGTDPQFGMYARNRDFARETDSFELFVAAANRLKPAFVVITGDLVHRPGDPAQIAEYLRIIRKLDGSIPIYHVAGNHDVGSVPTPARLAAYRKQFGRDYYSFRLGATAFFVLNSAVIAAPQRVPGELEKQEAWLRAELKKAREDGMRRLIVFQHHPWFLFSSTEADQFFNIPLAQRQRFLELLREHGVSHVFAGHYHMNFIARYGGMELVTTGPIGKPLGFDPPGFRVVIVRENGLEHQYYALEAPPDAVDVAR